MAGRSVQGRSSGGAAEGLSVEAQFKYRTSSFGEYARLAVIRVRGASACLFCAAGARVLWGNSDNSGGYFMGNRFIPKSDLEFVTRAENFVQNIAAIFQTPAERGFKNKLS
jgi:hypothetical protein